MALDEDVYCLGYVCLAMMTGLDTLHIKKNIHGCLLEVQARYSHKLLNLVKPMIQEEP